MKSRDRMSGGAGRHCKVFLIVVFALPFPNTSVFFFTSTVLQTKTNKLHLAILTSAIIFYSSYSSSFLAGIEGQDKRRDSVGVGQDEQRGGHGTGQDE